jgi:hypothetical protein
MAETKEAKRWKFLLRGNLTVAPVYDEDGGVAYMVVETDATLTKCRTPEEVNEAVDIAMHMAHIGQTVYVH